MTLSIISDNLIIKKWIGKPLTVQMNSCLEFLEGGISLRTPQQCDPSKYDTVLSITCTQPPRTQLPVMKKGNNKRAQGKKGEGENIACGC